MNAGLPVAEPRYLSLSDVVPSCCSKRLTGSVRLRVLAQYTTQQKVEANIQNKPD